MKLILTQEVTGLGGPGDVVEVKDGYGRNYLVPQGVAIRWTRGGEKTVESIKAARSSRAVRDLGHAEEVKAKIEGGEVDLDDLGAKVERAAQLIQLCRGKIERAEVQVRRIIESLDREAGA